MALEPDWTLCGGDWASHDLQHHRSGLKIQVKQAAARQSWDAGKSGRSAPRFAIATKTGRYDGADWIAGRSRNADIFIFAWHGETGADCDHANPEQWTFHIIAEPKLPTQKSIGLLQIARLAKGTGFSALSVAVEVAMATILDGSMEAVTANH